MLEIGMELDGGVLNVSLKGKLDGMTFTEFEEQLESKRDEADKIINASDDIKEIIELCGFDQVFDMK